MIISSPLLLLSFPLHLHLFDDDPGALTVATNDSDATAQIRAVAVVAGTGAAVLIAPEAKAAAQLEAGVRAGVEAGIPTTVKLNVGRDRNVTHITVHAHAHVHARLIALQAKAGAGARGAEEAEGAVGGAVGIKDLVREGTILLSLLKTARLKLWATTTALFTATVRMPSHLLVIVILIVSVIAASVSDEATMVERGVMS